MNMIVTFMIGNGFDLACGLKTRFTDVYEEYCKAESANETIANFKTEIRKSNYIYWTDFEMALPIYGKKLNDFEKLKECVIDFTIYLDSYLKKQELLIDTEIVEKRLGESMKEYVYAFYKYCLHESQSHLGIITNKTNEHCIAEFITFNYTNTLKKCLESFPDVILKEGSNVVTYVRRSPTHIHNVLGKGILLGVDDEKLYADIQCEDKRKIKILIDKLYKNTRQSNITNETLEILKASKIIVIMGWSIGDSDSYWVNSLKQLFIDNQNLNIVYFPYYQEALNPIISGVELEREDESKEWLQRKLEISGSELSRIHIITNPNYMKLDFISKVVEPLDEDGYEPQPVFERELVTIV